VELRNAAIPCGAPSLVIVTIGIDRRTVAAVVAESFVSTSSASLLSDYTPSRLFHSDLRRIDNLFLSQQSYAYRDFSLSFFCTYISLVWNRPCDVVVVVPAITGE